MKIILDTNVFISGIFFRGVPGKIIDLWNSGKIQLIMSIEIFDEYKRVSHELSKRFPGTSIERIVEIVGEKSKFYVPLDILHDECEDPDDQMFLNCAIVSKTKHIVTGDKALLKISGFKEIEILKPKDFIDRYFPEVAEF